MNMDTAILISLTTVRCYMDTSKSFSIASIARECEIDKETFYQHFPDKTSALEFFYTSIPLRYREMVDEIEGYDQFPAGVKIATYVYCIFDMLEEEPEFVRETFDPYVFKTWLTSEFESESRKLISEFLENEHHIPPMNKVVLNLPVDRFLAYELLHVIKFWLDDTSGESARSAELVEKLTAFIDEMLHTAVADRGYDLAKFLITYGVIRIPVPFIGRLLR